MYDWYLKRQPDVKEREELWGSLLFPPSLKSKIKKNKKAAFSSLLNAQGGASSVRRQQLHFTWKNHTWELELHGNSISAHVVNKGSALVSAALISFGCIMSNININTCTIDFSSLGCSGKRGRLRAQKKGIRFHWIRFGGFMSAVISWNSNLSLWPTLISLPEPIISLFFPFVHLFRRKKAMDLCEGKTKALISLPPRQLLPPPEPWNVCATAVPPREEGKYVGVQ